MIFIIKMIIFNEVVNNIRKKLCLPNIVTSDLKLSKMTFTSAPAGDFDTEDDRI